MPAFHVVSSIDIAVPSVKVHRALTDFNTWPIWSPWLLMERSCKITYHGSAGELEHGYEWDGQRVGSGKMSLKNINAKKVEADLTFLKPWKSFANVAFDIEPLDAATTRVSWHMNSKLPFFMFFAVKKVKAMIAADYGRGLKMLKEYLEKGKVRSNCIIEGIVDVPSTSYAGKTHKSSVDEINDSMGVAFPEIFNAIHDSSTYIAGKPFSVYEKMDLVNGTCTYTAAVPVAKSVKLNDGIKCYERTACRALRVVHTGAYRHLGNAWATANSELQNAKMKKHKTIQPFEVYLNDPSDVREEFLMTEIYFPLSS